jgi:hypothetical protein
MRFLATIMFTCAGVMVRYIEFELSENSILSLAIYTGFYFLGNKYLDRHIKIEKSKQENYNA